MDERKYIYLTDIDRGMGFAHLVINILIFLLQSLLLFVWFDISKSGNYESANTGRSQLSKDSMTIMVIMADFFLGITGIPITFAVAFSRGQAYRDIWWLCNLHAVLLFFSHVFSVVCLVVYSYSIYQAIVKNHVMPILRTVSLALFGGLFILLLAIVPIIAGISYYPSPCGYYSMIDWSSKDDVILSVIIMLVFIFTFCNAIIGFTYYRIYIKIVSAVHVIENLSYVLGRRESNEISAIRSQKRHSSRRKSARSSQTNKALIEAAWRSSLVPLAYVICWTPFFIKVTYEIVTSTRVSAKLDGAIASLATLNSLMDFFIIGFLNVTYRKSLYKLFGMSHS